METNKELKSCPFCGGEVKIIDENDFYMFCCNACGAGVTFAKELEDGTAVDCNMVESIESWNRRISKDDEVLRADNLINYSKKVAQMMSDLRDKSLDNIGHGDSPSMSFGAYAYFSERATMYDYEIPKVIKNFMEEQKNGKL